MNNLGDLFFESFKGFFKKRTPAQKRAVKKAARRAHRGTNFNRIGSKPGYIRVKNSNSKRYTFKRESAKQKTSKKIVGSKLGSSRFLR